MAYDDIDNDIESQDEQPSALPTSTKRLRRIRLAKDDPSRIDLDSLAGSDFSQFLPKEQQQPQEQTVMGSLKTGVQNTKDFVRMNMTNDPAQVAQIATEVAGRSHAQTDTEKKMAADIQPAVDEVTNAKGARENVTAWAKLLAKRAVQFAENPKQFLMSAAENMPNSAPGMAAGTAGGIAGGAVAGPLGAAAGAVVGGTAGGYSVEQGSSMYEQIIKEAQKRGIDTTDQKAMADMVKEKYDDFLTASRWKGIGTAGTDAILTRLTFGIGSIGEKALVKEAGAVAKAVRAGEITTEEATKRLTAIESKAAARNTMGAKAARGTAMTGAEMAGESTSEAVGQQLGYGQIDPLDVADEGLLAVGQGLGMHATEHVARPVLGMQDADSVDTSIDNAHQVVKSLKEGVAPSTPEPAADIHAQVQSMLDPSTTKDAVFVAAGNEDAIPQQLPENIIRIDRDEGTLLTTNPVKANTFSRSQQLSDDDMAKLLGFPQPKSAAVADPNANVVQGKDANGNVVAEAVTAPSGNGANEAAVASQVPAGGTVEAVSPELAQADRASKIAGQNPAVNELDAGNSTGQATAVAPVEQNMETAAEVPPAAPVAPRINLESTDHRYEALVSEIENDLNRNSDAPVVVDHNSVRIVDTDGESADPVYSKLATQLKKALNVDLLVIDAPGGIKDVEGNTVMRWPEGMSLGGSRTIVFNRAARGRSTLNVVGHELAHQLRAEYPEIWSKLADVALERMDSDAAGKQMRLLNQSGITSHDVMNDELVAEVVGEQMGQPEFWQQVMQSEDESFVNTLMKVLGDLLDKLTKAFTGSGFISSTRDVQAVRAAIKSAFAQWEAANKAAQSSSAKEETNAATANTQTTAASAGSETKAAQPVTQATTKQKGKKAAKDAAESKPVRVETVQADATSADAAPAAQKEAKPSETGDQPVKKKGQKDAKVETGAGRELIDVREMVNESVLVGTNDAGEKLYENSRGRFRLRNDRKDRPHGYPDFGGDLAPVKRKAKTPEETIKQLKQTVAKGLAPEQVNNTGRKLDPKNKFAPLYDPADPYQKAMMQDGLIPVTVDKESFKTMIDERAELFADPEHERKDLTRVAKTGPYIPQKNADAIVESWWEHAAAQGRDSAKANRNNGKTIITLFDFTEEMADPWKRAGYNVYSFDLQHGVDIMDLSPSWFDDQGIDPGDIYAILAMPPCTDFTNASSRHFKDKDADGRTEASKELVIRTLDLIEHYRPKVWMVENPVGRIESLTGLPQSRLFFDYSNFGSPEGKREMLWGKFNNDMPLANVKRTERKTDKVGGKSLETKNERSETPTGFSYSFFMANNYEDKADDVKLREDFPMASGAINEALKAGLSAEQVRDVLDNSYDELADEGDGAREALADAIKQHQQEGETDQGVRNTAVKEAQAKKLPATDDPVRQKYLDEVKKLGASISHLKSLQSAMSALESSGTPVSDDTMMAWLEANNPAAAEYANELKQRRARASSPFDIIAQQLDNGPKLKEKKETKPKAKKAAPVADDDLSEFDDKPTDSGTRYARVQTETPEFKKWFRESAITNDDGSPKVMYHGTAQDISEFRAKQAGAIFVTDDPLFAEGFAGESQNWMAKNYRELLTPEQLEQARRNAIAKVKANETGSDLRWQLSMLRDTNDDTVRGSDYWDAEIKAMLPGAQNILPLYVKAEHPFDYQNNDHIVELEDHLQQKYGITLDDPMTITDHADTARPPLHRVIDRISGGEWTVIESKEIQAALRDLGHDGFYVVEGGRKNLAVYQPEQLKSAVGNYGKFDPRNPDIRYARTRNPLPAYTNDMTPEQIDAIRNLGGLPTKLTLKQKIQQITQNASMKLQQGLVDQFAPLMKLGLHQYMLARLTKSADTPLETVLMHGIPYLNDAGAVDVKYEGKGAIAALRQLNGEHERFFNWIAGNRAEQLKKEGRENLLTDTDITALKSLDDGDMKDGQKRSVLYRKVLADFNRYNNAILDMAEKAGIIDGDDRKIWQKDFYVPFYRVSEDKNYTGPSNVSGMVNQEAFKRLRGGTGQVGDLMQNTLRNWSHLISASLHNQAAKAALTSAETAGVAYRTNAAEKGSVYYLGRTTRTIPKGKAYMEGGIPKVSDGTAEVKEFGKVHYQVTDPFLLDAITSLEFAGWNNPMMKALQQAKHYLTLGATIGPVFKANNLIRDQIAAMAANPVSYNVLNNLSQGWKGTDKESKQYASMLAGGGMLRFGSFLEDDNGARLKRLVSKGIKDVQVVDTRHKAMNVLRELGDKWHEFGDRTENMTRAAVYKQRYDQMINDGKTADEAHLMASFAARDSMDFSLQGSWTSVRFLVKMVPFLNARLQGLYKLGRDGVMPTGRMLAPQLFGSANATDKQKALRFAAVTGTVAMASIGLMLAFKDDDDWKNREDWDRDAYWWFKIGGTAYRIPKPFEIGAIGTLAERSVELAMSSLNIDDRARFLDSLKSMVTQTFAMDPTPQLVKPLIDLYANKDPFTKRQIETAGMENMTKGQRIGANTSAVAQLLGNVTSPLGVSPVQLDYLTRAYFGWLGTHIVMTTDMALRPVMGLPDQPARRFPDDYMVLGDFARELPANQSRYLTKLYEQAKDIQQVMGDIRHFQQIGNMEKARELMDENRDKVALNGLYGTATRQLTAINHRIMQVQASGATPDEKRAEIDRLNESKIRLARMVDDRRQDHLQ